jgi:hypothetical protein
LIDTDEITRELALDPSRAVGAVGVDGRTLVAADDLAAGGTVDLAGAVSALGRGTRYSEGAGGRKREAAEAEERQS